MDAVPSGRMVQLPSGASVLAPFVEAEVFGSFEVHLVATVARLQPATSEDVLLALALAARAPRFGHVCADLHDLDRQIARSVDSEGQGALTWPSVESWSRALDESVLVAAPDERPTTSVRPLVWDGRRVYLQRYWHYEEAVAADLVGRALDRTEPTADDESGGAADALTTVLDHLFGSDDQAEPDLQRKAVYRSLTQGISIIAGGPGTGKTHTIARVLMASQLMQNGNGPRLRVALAAPTGKAAARMGEAVSRELATLRGDGTIGAECSHSLDEVQPSTVHRLLGWRDRTHFRHDRTRPLPHDLVIVDEASMVSLPLMAKLLDAVRPESRVVLVGDPYQLASIEAGTVLGDVVGPAVEPAASPAVGSAVESVVGSAVESRASGGVLADRITELKRMRRFAEGSAIAEVAEAIRTGDADRTFELLDGDRSEAVWIRDEDEDAIGDIRHLLISAGVEVAVAAQEGHGREALDASSRIKVITATRQGPFGRYAWSDSIEQGVADQVTAVTRARRWYVGRPIIVTSNDLINGVFNGDVGVVVNHDGVVTVDLSEGGAIRSLAPSRLDQVETWWAMTIHKSQGSEFPHVVVSLPQAESPILTRQLLYTAVTRAKERLTVIGSEASLRVAIGRPISRASGLRERLWPLEQ